MAAGLAAAVVVPGKRKLNFWAYVSQPANPTAQPGTGGNSSVQPVIKLTDIHKTYFHGEVDVKAVQGVTLDIKPGEFVAL
ncbi:MAG: macrolide transporter ATP-binding protein, partial [Verrucomicrobia bacterium]|nr:macrolide transporter ATP-binding protein [Verrucomicrobiota bacterium]